VPLGSFQGSPPCDRPIFLPTWDEITVVQLSARLAFSYVFAFVIFAWSSGIAALR
jgi:hypothetical protein